MNTNPDPVTTRELSSCKRNFDQALKGMVEVGFFFLITKTTFFKLQISITKEILTRNSIN